MITNNKKYLDFIALVSIRIIYLGECKLCNCKNYSKETGYHTSSQVQGVKNEF
jgi:hypothetical protein